MNVFEVCLFPVGAESVSKLCHLPVVLERFTCVRSDEHRIASHEEGVSTLGPAYNEFGYYEHPGLTSKLPYSTLWSVHTARQR